MIFRRLLLLGLLCLQAASSQATPPSRPNILWIVSEDNNPWLGCYGDELARTPTLDTLARRGVRYVNAHAASPVCAPSRSSMITGRYATALGTQHMRSIVTLPKGLRYFPAYLRDAGYFCTNRAKTDYNAAILPDTWDQNGPQAHWKNRAPGQPFFAVFNFASSHESNLHERRPLRTDPAKVHVPAYLPDVPEVRADIAQYHDCLATTDTQIRTLLAELDAAGLMDETIVFYFSDNGGVLPRSKRFLYDNGTRVPLIIAFPDKWKSLAPAPFGSAVDEMVNLLDLPATVLSLAGVAAPADLDSRALAGAARAPAPRFTYAFRDRMDEGYDLGRAVIGPRFRYIRNYRPEIPAGQRLDYLWRMASTREWERLYRTGALEPIQKAFFLPRPPEMLFDVAADPDCVRDLATDPAYRVVLEEMRAANRAHLLATRDLGFMPEPMVRALAGPASPVNVCADSKIYPLAELLDLIDRLQLPATPPKDALLDALQSPIAIVRYWAATCAVRSVPSPPELAGLLVDVDPSVRLAAAFSTLQQQADSAAAWKVIAASLRGDRPPEERLTAVNMVTLIGRFPESIRRTLEVEPAPSSALFANFYRRQVDFALGREPPVATAKES